MIAVNNKSDHDHGHDHYRVTMNTTMTNMAAYYEIGAYKIPICFLWCMIFVHFIPDLFSS